MGGSEAVRHERALGLARRALVLQELEHRVPEQQAHLPQRAAGNPDGLPELLPVEPRARLVGEREAEDVVVEADRRFEILDGDADVVQTLHGSSVQSSFVVRRCRRRPRRSITDAMSASARPLPIASSSTSRGRLRGRDAHAETRREILRERDVLAHQRGREGDRLACRDGGTRLACRARTARRARRPRARRRRARARSRTPRRGPASRRPTRWSRRSSC